MSAGALLPRYDVAIIGAGITGLSAALPLLRAGRSVAIFECDFAGSGASRRNAGFLGRVLKKTLADLTRERGLEAAIAIYRELDEALQQTLGFIAAEGLECDAERCGRFIGAVSEAHLRLLETDFDMMQKHLGVPYHMVPRAEQASEVGTDSFHGGVLIPDLAALHPGKYHRGLLDLVLAAGGALFDTTMVEAVEADFGDKRIVTSHGETRAADVVVGTNGYTTKNLAWHARRVLPFTGYMAATELLSDEQLRAAIPAGRTVLGSNTNIDFFRRAPDSPRLLFGGATASGFDTPAKIAQGMRKVLGRTFPDLAGVGLDFVWSGQCAGTFDMMPHLGGRDRVWYAMGYNFAGVPMGTHMGRKLAHKIMGRPEGRSAFDSERFPTVPFYTGKAWFMPWVMRYFDWQDARIASGRR